MQAGTVTSVDGLRYYEKLTKRDKKKIDKGYEHKQFAESKRTDE